MRVGNYASDMSWLLQSHNETIELWVQGRLHRGIDILDAGVRVLCNPRGYHKEPLTEASALTFSLSVAFNVSAADIVRSQAVFAKNPFRHGIGLLIATAQGTFDAAGVFAAMMVLAVVALAARYRLTAIENKLLKWRRSLLSKECDAGRCNFTKPNRSDAQSHDQSIPCGIGDKYKSI